MRISRVGAALFAALAVCLAGCRERLPPGLDEMWYLGFDSALERKVAASDAVLVGRRVLSLRREGTVSLYRIEEVLKGGEMITAAMAPYPEQPDSVMVAYANPPTGESHDEPVGSTIVFLTRPPAPGKNMHLLGDLIEQGMIHALPSLVRKARACCGR